MLRTTVDKAYVKRTLRELYSHSASTPKDCLFDPAWDNSVAIYPGMGVINKATAASGASDVVTLPSAAGQIVVGLCGLFIGGEGINELTAAGVNSCPVWVLSPGSEFEVLSPAFDTTATWTFPTDGTELLATVMFSGANRGKLVPSGTANSTTKPVARVLSRPSTDRIIISGLSTGAAY